MPALRHEREWVTDPLTVVLADILTGPRFDGAACRDVDPELWFPDKGSGGRRHQFPIDVCEFCPCREECLEWALEHNEQWGIWGGMTRHQRDQLKRERRVAG